MVLSLEDQVVDRWLFYDWHLAELDEVIYPTKVGWSPIPSGYRDVERTFPHLCLNTDCSSFDWTLPSWVVDLVIELRLSQCRNMTTEYEAAVRNRYREVLGTGAIVRLPDGSRYCQTRPGMMKSGWFRTLSDNSLAQLLIHGLAFYRAFGTLPPTIWTMGDDVLMNWGKDLSSEALCDSLRSLGVIAKRAGPEREFAGFKFPGGGVVEPSYPMKHQFVLASVPPDEFQMVVDGYSLIYALARPSPLVDYIRRHSKILQPLARAWAKGLSRVSVPRNLLELDFL